MVSLIARNFGKKPNFLSFVGKRVISFSGLTCLIIGYHKKRIIRILELIVLSLSKN